MHNVPIHMRQSILALILILMLAGFATAQNTTLPLHPPFRKNSISFAFRNYNCFDGNGMQWGRRLAAFRPFGLGWNIEYTHHFTERAGIIALLGAFGGWNAPPPYGTPWPKDWPAGIVYERQMAVLDIGYLRHVPILPWLRLRATGGTTFRYGWEYITLWYWQGSDNLGGQGYRLADLGLTAGLGLECLLGSRIRIGFDTRYTEFILRTDRHRETYYANYAGGGATRRMLALQLGMGYRF